MTAFDARSPRHLPELDALTVALSSVLGAPATVVGRRPHLYASSSPGEIVHCAVGSRELTLLCKYGAGRGPSGFGHRGGVPYEALVYRDVLADLPLPTVGFHGSWTWGTTGDTWLFLEYVHDPRRPDEDSETEAAMAAAARWAGHFHRLTAGRPADAGRSWLTVYSGGYYAQWARRTSELAGERHAWLPWLAPLCRRAKPLLRSMADLPSCTVHGELTLKNLLVSARGVLPVDWETAAVGLGAIDLAALVDGWPAPVARRLESAYVSTRWPDGVPTDHARTLDLARLYWDLRWLGDRPDWLSDPPVSRRYRTLRAVGQRLGLVEAGAR